MRLQAPLTGEPEEVFRAEHRIVSWQNGWGAEGGTLMLTQRERMRRWMPGEIRPKLRRVK